MVFIAQSISDHVDPFGRAGIQLYGVFVPRPETWQRLRRTPLGVFSVATLLRYETTVHIGIQTQ
jgi:hypothetical protein